MITFTDTRNGKTFVSSKISNRDATADYLFQRRTEIDADLKATGKRVANLKLVMDPNGGYECRPDAGMSYRFTLKATYAAIPLSPVAPSTYRDATLADWQSGKFHA